MARHPERFVGMCLIFLMGLSACANEAPATAVVMPDTIIPMTDSASAELCQGLAGTKQVSMEIEVVGDEARVSGCVDPELGAGSATLVYFGPCLGNEDLALCKYPMVVIDGYFGGGAPYFGDGTAIGALIISQPISGDQFSCHIVGINRGDDPTVITMQCPDTAAPGEEF